MLINPTITHCVFYEPDAEQHDKSILSPYDLDLARNYADADELKVFIDDSSEPGKVGLQDWHTFPSGV